MRDKQIMIDGVKYNPCNDCELWNGHHCIGARSYEPNANEHKAICNEHMAKQFYKVYQQLYRKTQECEELKERLERTEEDLKYQCVDCMNVKSDRYRKALEEIEKVCIEDTREFADGTQLRYDSLDEILDIINKAKG